MADVRHYKQLFDQGESLLLSIEHRVLNCPSTKKLLNEHGGLMFLLLHLDFPLQIRNFVFFQIHMLMGIILQLLSLLVVGSKRSRLYVLDVEVVLFVVQNVLVLLLRPLQLLLGLFELLQVELLQFQVFLLRDL